MSFNINVLVNKKVLVKVPGFDFRGTFLGVLENGGAYAIKEGEEVVLVPVQIALIKEIAERKPTLIKPETAQNGILQ